MSRIQFLSLLLLLPATLPLFMSCVLVYSHNPVLNPGETTAKATTAGDLSALHPSSQGITFTPGPHSTKTEHCCWVAGGAQLNQLQFCTEV